MASGADADNMSAHDFLLPLKMECYTGTAKGDAWATCTEMEAGDKAAFQDFYNCLYSASASAMAGLPGRDTYDCPIDMHPCGYLPEVWGHTDGCLCGLLKELYDKGNADAMADIEDLVARQKEYHKGVFDYYMARADARARTCREGVDHPCSVSLWKGG